MKYERHIKISWSYSAQQFLLLCYILILLWSQLFWYIREVYVEEKSKNTNILSDISRHTINYITIEYGSLIIIKNYYFFQFFLNSNMNCTKIWKFMKKSLKYGENIRAFISKRPTPSTSFSRENLPLAKNTTI